MGHFHEGNERCSERERERERESFHAHESDLPFQSLLSVWWKSKRRKKKKSLIWTTELRKLLETEYFRFGYEKRLEQSFWGPLPPFPLSSTHVASLIHMKYLILSHCILINFHWLFLIKTIGQNVVPNLSLNELKKHHNLSLYLMCISAGYYKIHKKWKILHPV